MFASALKILACSFTFLAVSKFAFFFGSRLKMLAHTQNSLKLEDILRDRTLCFLTFLLVSVIVSYATMPWLLVPSALLAWILSKRAPSMLDARHARELRSACDEQVDIMADIVAMGVRSGLSFDAAVDLYCQKFDNELARQFRQARVEWRSNLASRKEAMNALASRVDSRALKRFSETSLQAIHHGSPLADMLNRFSEDIRQRRRTAIERQIEKAPIKLLIPTGTCILPAMLIMVMGPVLIQFVETGF